MKSKKLFSTDNKDDFEKKSKSTVRELNETSYLMKSPKNAKRLLRGLDEYERELTKK
jgi:PHD/YefM family antitoxin component YafN of YafNO toxin-antitoxin module